MQKEFSEEINIHYGGQMTTPKGDFTVDYEFVNGRIDLVQERFKSKGLHLISPAEYVKMNTLHDDAMNFPDHEFGNMTNTNLDVFYDTLTKKVVLVKNNALSKGIEGMAKELADSYKRNPNNSEPASPQNLAFLTKAQTDLAHILIKSAEKTNSAIIIPTGALTLDYGEVGFNVVANFLFTDESLGTHANDYMYYAQLFRPQKDITMLFDNAKFMSVQKMPYLKKLAMGGRQNKLYIFGTYTSEDNAYGVKFTQK